MATTDAHFQVTATMSKEEAAVKSFAKSLLSRKLLLAVAGIALALAHKDYGQATAVVLAYLGVEGAADVVTRVKQ